MEQERIKNPLMEFYRHTYRFSKRWNGKESLEKKRVIVYFEQGYGDIIQFLRYLKPLKERGCYIIAAVPEALHPLLPYIEGIDEFFDKQSSILPKHDLHILSLSLPFLLNMVTDMFPEPYINYNNKADLKGYERGLNIGIAWEGSPDHPKNLDRCCPLKLFKTLLKDNVNLFMLQNKVNLYHLVEGVDFPLYTITIYNFDDTASLINAVDLVVTIDTSVLHLAGAMGKRTYALLGPEADPRWKVANWYNSVTLLEGEWQEIFSTLKCLI